MVVKLYNCWWALHKQSWNEITEPKVLWEPKDLLSQLILEELLVAGARVYPSYLSQVCTMDRSPIWHGALSRHLKRKVIFKMFTLAYVTQTQKHTHRYACTQISFSVQKFNFWTPDTLYSLCALRKFQVLHCICQHCIVYQNWLLSHCHKIIL